jgi:uncharacterized protein (DUF1697 family)
MSDRRAALLRGINVGPNKRIAMADLRQVFEGLGHRDVRTLLNSGNVAFTVGGRAGNDDGGRIEKAIKDHCGVTTRVTVLTRKELAAAVEDNPLTKIADDPARLLVVVFQDATIVAQMRPLLKERWSPEALALGKRVAYLWCANGLLDGKLWPAVGRVAGDACTARNITTMTKLLALVDQA